MIRPLAQVEKEAVLSAVVECDFNINRAAELLEISRVTLYRRLQEWGLTPPMGKSSFQILRADYIKHCERIKKALEEVRCQQEEVCQ